MAVLSYLRSVREELGHVSWPSPRQTAVYTILVVAVTALTALYLGVIDAIFLFVIEWVIAGTV